jgi:hypothetical protein
MYQISYIWSDFSTSISKAPRAEGGCTKFTDIWLECYRSINRRARAEV